MQRPRPESKLKWRDQDQLNNYYNVHKSIYTFMFALLTAKTAKKALWQCIISSAGYRNKTPKQRGKDCIEWPLTSQNNDSVSPLQASSSSQQESFYNLVTFDQFPCLSEERTDDLQSSTITNVHTTNRLNECTSHNDWTEVARHVRQKTTSCRWPTSLSSLCNGLDTLSVSVTWPRLTS